MSTLASQRRATVAEIYAGFVSADVARVADVFDRALADEVVLHEPESLPYGGRYEGLETLKQFVAGLTDPQSPIDARRLEVEFILASDEEPHVIAGVRFPWAPPGVDSPLPMRALEQFTFEGSRIVEMRVFLWDTAACLACFAQHEEGSP